MTGLDMAIKIAGGQSALARALGVPRQVVHAWTVRGGRVPPERCPEIEAATGVSCEALRPDVFVRRKRKEVVA